jgi:hypothetical protein
MLPLRGSQVHQQFTDLPQPLLGFAVMGVGWGFDLFSACRC